MSMKNLTSKVLQLTPLLRCHWPVSPDDSRKMSLRVDPGISCSGQPRPSLWLASPAAVAVFSTNCCCLLLSAALHCLVLWLLHAGRVRIKDLGVLGICANAVSDLALTLNLAGNEVLAPLLLQQPPEMGGIIAVIADVQPAVLCRFRVYITQWCLSMDIMVTACVACFAGKRLRQSFLESAPCGIFMLPGLLAFLTLGLNVWFLVLSECRQLAFVHSRTKLWTVLPVLLSEYSWVGCVLFGLAASTQIVPCAITACSLCRRTNRDEEDVSAQQQMTLAAWLLLAHLLSLISSVLLAGYFTQEPLLQRASFSLLALSMSGSLCLCAMLVLKPVAYLLLHPELRTTFAARVLRRRQLLPGRPDSLRAGSGIRRQLLPSNNTTPSVNGIAEEEESATPGLAGGD